MRVLENDVQTMMELQQRDKEKLKEDNAAAQEKIDEEVS